MALFYFGPILFWHLGLFHLHAWHPPPVLRNRVMVNFLRAIGGKTALGKTGFGKSETVFGKTGFDNTGFGKTGLGKSGLFFTTNMRFPFAFVFVYAIVRCCIHKKKNKNVKRNIFFCGFLLFYFIFTHSTICVIHYVLV